MAMFDPIHCFEMSSVSSNNSKIKESCVLLTIAPKSFIDESEQMSNSTKKVVYFG